METRANGDDGQRITTDRCRGVLGMCYISVRRRAFYRQIRHLSLEWKSYSQVAIHGVVGGIDVHYPGYISFPRAILLASSGNRVYRGIKRLVDEISHEFRFDLIHAHMALPDDYAGMFVSMAYQKPSVATFQATDIDITVNRSKDCLRVLRKVFSHANRVIAPSPRLAKVVAAKFSIEPIIIGNGVDINDVFTKESDLLLNYKGRRIILSVSRLIPTKGIELDIFAVKRLIDTYENLLYLVVGDGLGKNTLEQLTSSLNLTKHVRFVGQVPHVKVMEYMDSCEVFTLPSWQETFGLVYVEAMAHSKPVVGVQGQGIDGIVEHGKTGMLVQPRDVDSLVEALDFFLSHPEEAKAMGERGRRLVWENYTWEKNAEKTIAVYEDVLKHAGR